MKKFWGLPAWERLLVTGLLFLIVLGGSLFLTNPQSKLSAAPYGEPEQPAVTVEP